MKRYIAGQTINWEWTESEVKAFIEVWACGCRHCREAYFLADIFKRAPVDVAVLILDLGERGFITQSGRGTTKRGLME